MSSSHIQKLLRPCQLYFRPCWQRSSTIASTTPMRETDTVKPFNEIPGPTGIHDIPFIGMALQFKPFTNYGILDLTEVLGSLRDKYGDILRLRSGAKHVIYISSPEYAEQILRSPFKEHRRIVPVIAETFYERNDMGARALSVMNGEEWKSLRKPVQERLKPATIANYLPLVEQVSCDFINSIKNKTEIEDFLPELIKFSAESVGMLTLNRRLGCIDKTPPIDFESVMDTLLKSFQTSFLMPVNTFRYFRTKLYRDFESNFLILFDLVYKVMKEQMEFLKKLEKEGTLHDYLEKEHNFLHSLLSDENITIQQAAQVVIDFFTGGVSATANGILFTLCDLALHPEKQATLYNEISNVIGDSPHVTRKHLDQMSYLKACLKETQRMKYPPFLGMVRFMETDINVAGYRIPEGTQVIINNELMCMDERYFPRPKEYQPERWTRDDSTEISKGFKNHPFIMKPFGFGARNCPGQRVAEMQMLIGTAKIIQNFELSMPDDVKEIEWHRRVFPTPVNKVKMCLKLRRPEST